MRPIQNIIKEIIKPLQNKPTWYYIITGIVLLEIIGVIVGICNPKQLK